jgi:hypothetical protein
MIGKALFIEFRQVIVKIYVRNHPLNSLYVAKIIRNHIITCFIVVNPKVGDVVCEEE